MRTGSRAGWALSLGLVSLCQAQQFQRFPPHRPDCGDPSPLPSSSRGLVEEALTALEAAGWCDATLRAAYPPWLRKRVTQRTTNHACQDFLDRSDNANKTKRSTQDHSVKSRNSVSSSIKIKSSLKTRHCKQAQEQSATFDKHRPRHPSRSGLCECVTHQTTAATRLQDRC